jgi:hypothetical protein
MSENWIPADLKTAEVKAVEDGGKILVVRGIARSASGKGPEVRLLAIDYLALPEYWRIDVLSNSPSEGSLSDYETSLKLDGTCGSKGVEVFGRETSIKIDVHSSPR